jgi:hypothetical protein
MENARKHYGLSDNSPLLSVPSCLSSRCQRNGCLGTECAEWKLCGPTSPFGTYLSHLPHTFVTGNDLLAKAASASA